jgi:predicted outer membrane repeat protein
MTNCEFKENKSTQGGAVYSDGLNIEIYNSIFDGNSTEGYDSAGALYLCKSNNILIENCSVINNVATIGAGIECINSNAIIKDCMINNNRIQNKKENSSLQVSGCGISLQNTLNVLIFGCEIMDNKPLGLFKSYGGGICCYNNLSSDIIDCTIEGNAALWGAGVASIEESMVSISNCVISQNKTAQYPETQSAGGGIFCGYNSTSFISDNIINNNRSDYGGGIHFFENSNSRINNCLIYNNTAKISGGGIYSDNSKPKIMSCTIADNSSVDIGGITSENSSSIAIDNSIIWGNANASFGGAGTLNYSNCDIENISNEFNSFGQDPIFVSGPQGDYYLSHTASGQNSDSPCVNSGNDSSQRYNLSMRTTRIDGIFDDSIVDMGFHYPPHIIFDIDLIPVKDTNDNIDQYEVLIDVTTVGKTRNVDLYLVMMDPDGKLYFAPSWSEVTVPFVNNVLLPGDLELSDISIESISFSSLPVSKHGNYTFAFAAFIHGTGLIISNITTNEVNFLLDTSSE